MKAALLYLTLKIIFHHTFTADSIYPIECVEDSLNVILGPVGTARFLQKNAVIFCAYYRKTQLSYTVWAGNYIQPHIVDFVIEVISVHYRAILFSHFCLTTGDGLRPTNTTSDLLLYW